MNTIELFSGTKSFSTVAAALGHNTLTIDNDRELNPDYVCDMRSLNNISAPGVYEILWASPPCQGFSVAAIGRNWNFDNTPKTDSARLGIELLIKTIDLIEQGRPTWWFIENPRGKMRKMPQLIEFLARSGGVQHTVTYCQYGDTRMKPTDIWTNATWWHPKAACKNGDNCHVAAPRGSVTGTQGIKGAKDRGRIPAELFEEIFQQHGQILS